MGFTNEMPKHSYLKSAHPFKIFAHRGLCFRNGELIHDENTIAAFREAVAQGIEYIELDVQSSQDRKAVVFHDDRLDRVSEVEGLICDKNSPRFKAFRSNSEAKSVRSRKYSQPCQLTAK